jgi:hypothetical protein
MSPQRIDYYDSPEAPRANSLVPAVNVVIVNDAGKILLIRPPTTTTGPSRAAPSISASRSPRLLSARRSRSPGLSAITGIVGIYSDPKHLILYTSNGEVRQEFSIVVTALPLSGQPTPSSESSEVRWGPEAELPGYTMDRSMRIRINDFLSRSDSPVIIWVLKPAAKAALHSRPVKSSATRASRCRTGGNPKDNDLTSDYGLSFRQTQRDDPRLS